MKKSQLKQIVKEEIKNVLKEDVRKDYADYKSKWKALESAFKAYKNNIAKNLPSGHLDDVKRIERELLDLHLEADELISTYGYGD